MSAKANQTKKPAAPATAKASDRVKNTPKTAHNARPATQASDPVATPRISANTALIPVSAPVRGNSTRHLALVPQRTLTPLEQSLQGKEVRQAGGTVTLNANYDTPIQLPCIPDAPKNAVLAAFLQAQAAKSVAPKTKGAPKPRAHKEIENGVTKPGEGGVCRLIWDALDTMVKAGTFPGVADIKAHGEAQQPAWDSTTCSVQYYRWRKYNGIKGRV